MKGIFEANNFRYKIDMQLKNVFITVFFITFSVSAFSQDTDNSNALKYTVTYDDPYDLSKLFIHFQPIIGDISALNSIGGPGLEANYYYKNLLDFELSGRTSYTAAFDIANNAGSLNAFNDNALSTYYYGEIGGTYHIIDRTKASSSKILLYSKRLKGTEWAATVAKNAVIKNTVREIVGGRAGAMFYTTAVDLESTLAKQEMELFYANGTVIDEYLYTNVFAYSAYIGGSMSWFKNFAVTFESRWEPNGDDLLMTTYLDVLYSPGITIDDLLVNNSKTKQVETISLENIKRAPFGFRAGFKGKFNRSLGWGYGVETGLRPGVQKNGFFFTCKLSFPVFGTKLEQTVEAINTETGE